MWKKGYFKTGLVGKSGTHRVLNDWVIMLHLRGCVRSCLKTLAFKDGLGNTWLQELLISFLPVYSRIYKD